MDRMAAGTQNCTLVLLHRRPCMHSTGEACRYTIVLHLPSLTCFSYADPPSLYKIWSPSGNRAEATLLNNIHSDSSLCLFLKNPLPNLVKSDQQGSDMCFTLAAEGGWQWHCREGAAHASHLLQLCKQCTGTSWPCTVGLTGFPIRSRGLSSWERMGCEERGQRDHSTPHHAKLALISCAAHRGTTPKQQFYSKGEDPQGYLSLLQGCYERCSGHVWCLQLTTRRSL